MIHLVTDVRPGEPDILTSVRHEPLLVTADNGRVVHTAPAPTGVWTHETLAAATSSPRITEAGPADAYLGGTWIGSTEA